jgi:hypothetical protein
LKIYIAGEINGLENFKELFQAAEDKLKSQGHLIMNPAILPIGFPYEAYMPICTSMIDQCDAVYMLSNWKDSKGAMVEHAYADATNKLIYYQDFEEE